MIFIFFVQQQNLIQKTQHHRFIRSRHDLVLSNGNLVQVNFLEITAHHFVLDEDIVASASLADDLIFFWTILLTVSAE